MIAREEFLPQLRALGLALGVHLFVAALMVIGTWNWKPFKKAEPVGLMIEAVIVDTGAIKAQREEAQKAAEDAEQKRQAQERRAKELEQQKQREKEAEIKRQQDLEKQRLQALEEQRRKEAQAEALRKKEAQDKLAALRMERERKLEEERLKQQRELEAVRQQAEAAERQRQQEAERLKQLEQRKQTEAAEQRRKLEEAERQKQAQEQAFQAGRAAELGDKYKAAIQSAVTQNWLRPPTAQAGLRCTLKIVQIPGGEVISAAIAGACNGDEATRRSIIAAVERVGALPYRGFEEVFEREIDFNFIYDGD
ncbi:MAG TPA: cell envelope integrity protein TolA [Xanthomonadales bacterium]|nr:cell envelope integrity protein TolA [Xanthomonadales bacterium]